MIVYTSTEIATRFGVTQEQMDKATRILDCTSGKVFYQVESQTTLFTIYEVRYNATWKRLTCTCAAGNPPIDQITGLPMYAPRPCWHKRAAMAATFEYSQQENAQARQEAEQAAASHVAQVPDVAEMRYRALVKQRDEDRARAGTTKGKPNSTFTFLR